MEPTWVPVEAGGEEADELHRELWELEHHDDLDDWIEVLTWSRRSDPDLGEKAREERQEAIVTRLGELGSEVVAANPVSGCFLAEALIFHDFLEDGLFERAHVFHDAAGAVEFRQALEVALLGHLGHRTREAEEGLPAMARRLDEFRRRHPAEYRALAWEEEECPDVELDELGRILARVGAVFEAIAWLRELEARGAGFWASD